MKNILKFIISILICLGAGWVGSFFTSQSVSTWYLEITKPSFNPPSWVFAPVWITLFVLMGISLFLIWKNGFKTEELKKLLVLFVFQLLLNVTWSLLFFSMQNPFLAFIEIILLWLVILLTLVYLYKHSKLAGWLFLPYLLWVSFAAFLNYSIWQLN